jgi:hypothetical protein
MRKNDSENPMRKLHQALKEEEIERLTRNLTDQGYTTGAQSSDDTPFDIVARKAHHTIAYLVLVRGAENGEALTRATDLRTLARQKGYDFRVAFVNPPHEKTIVVEGLDRLLYEYLAQLSASHPDDFPGVVSIEHIGGIRIDSLVAHPENIIVTGSGVVDAKLAIPEPQAAEPQIYLVDAPLHFTVNLRHGLQIQPEGTSLQMDTSDYLPL